MKTSSLILAGALALAVAGCASTGPKGPPPKPLTQEEIIQMAKSGALDTDIIQKIRASGTVYRLTAAEILHLHDSGVNNGVIDFMLQDYLEAVRWQEREYSRRYYDWYAFGPHWYWCWPHDVVIVRGRP
ncbi:MAG: hypothetical protein HZA91_18635 [Verrucomicrobia bacterium]|nr:hypothetical protein [Verrucomicrobiota bacterium]